MQAQINVASDAGHSVICLQVSCQRCGWHTICIVASVGCVILHSRAGTHMHQHMLRRYLRRSHHHRRKELQSIPARKIHETGAHSRQRSGLETQRHRACLCCSCDHISAVICWRQPLISVFTTLQVSCQGFRWHTLCNSTVCDLHHSDQ